MPLDDLSVTLADIQAAATRISDVVFKSPCPYCLQLSRLTGAEIWCKMDHLQRTGSFKERGARNKLLSLNDSQRKAGVVAASAGNHALGLAYHGQLLNIPVTVVMPTSASIVKIANCRSFGANVILQGDNFDQASQYARLLAEQRSCTFVSGFDDPLIIAGQGTLGLEILQDIPDVDAILIGVGGGGLISGVGVAVKSLRPQTKIIGVEPNHAPSMYESLKQKRIFHIDPLPTLADGLAISQIGQLPFQIAPRVVDRVVLVNEAQIALSVLRLLELEKTVVEGAGAAPLAAAMDSSLGLKGKKVVLLLGGGNIDVTLISRVIERGLAAEGRLCRITVPITDRPGSLAALLTTVAQTGASVKEVFHDRNFGPADVAQVKVTCVVETRDLAHINQIRKTLAEAKLDGVVEGVAEK